MATARALLDGMAARSGRIQQQRKYRGNRLPLSYINFYIAYDGIIMPRFDDPMDQSARDALAEVFPEREIVQVAAWKLSRAGAVSIALPNSNQKSE